MFILYYCYCLLLFDICQCFCIFVCCCWKKSVNYLFVCVFCVTFAPAFAPISVLSRFFGGVGLRIALWYAYIKQRRSSTRSWIPSVSFFEALHGFLGMTWTVDSFSPARFSRRRTWYVRVPHGGWVPFWGFRFFHASTTILPDTGVLGQIKTAGIREPPVKVSFSAFSAAAATATPQSAPLWEELRQNTQILS